MTSAYAAAVLADSPVAYYRMDEASGTVLHDSSGNARDGTIVGTPTYGAGSLLVGDSDAAMSLPGNLADYLSLPTAGMPSGVMTVEMLISLPTTDETLVFDFGSVGAWADLTLQWSGGTDGGWDIGIHNAYGNIGGTIAANTTYHIAVVLDATLTATLYVNGAVVGSKSGLSAIEWDHAYIGIDANNTPSTSYPFAGTIDEVAVYDSVLSPARIAAHYYAATQFSQGVYRVMVAGSPVNVVAGTLDVKNQIGQRSTGQLSIWGPLGVRYQYGTQLQIYDANNTLVFSGYISQDKAYKSGSPQGHGYLEHDLTLMDNCYRADKRAVWRSYLNTNAGPIVRDLVDRVLSQEGVTYTANSIATGAPVPEVVWNGKKASEALSWLATQSGYWWNIDTAGVLWFLPYSGIAAPWILDGTQTDVENLAVTSGNDMYVNTQYTRGGYSEKGTKAAPLVETFHGNGVTRSFTLSYDMSTLYSILLNGVDVTTDCLTKGSNGGQFYYAPSDPVIAQDPAQTVLGTGDTLVVSYAGRLPSVGKASNASLIATQKAREGSGSSGIVESVYTDTKIHTLPAALQIASAMLAHYGQETTLLDFDTQATGLIEGQMLTVTLPDFALTSAQMLVTSVEISDQRDSMNIWFHVQAVGSPYDQAQWQTYFANLMNQQADPSDLSDTTDTTFTPIVTTAFTHTPSFAITGQTAVAPICDESSGPHTFVCDLWTAA